MAEPAKDDNTITVTSEEQAQPEPDKEPEASEPVLPSTLEQASKRDDLTDPRLIAAAQSVGALPADPIAAPEAQAPAKRDDLTDPRMLAAARAAGIKIPSEAEAVPPAKSSEPVSVAVVESSAVTKGLVVLPPVREGSTPQRKIVQLEEKTSEPPPLAPPVPQKPADIPVLPPPVADKKPAAPSSPPKAVYPVSAPDRRMVPYYEKQLERENLDPVIRAYYERKLTEAQAAPLEDM